MDYNNYYNTPAEPDYVSAVSRLSLIMRSVYLKMTLGLIVTAFTAMFCTAGPIANLLYNSGFSMLLLFAAEIGLVIYLSSRINKMSSGTATAMFLLFSVVNGAVLAPIFFVYTAASIAKTFFITAAVFGAMTVYGYFTTKDLTSWGTFLFMALIGLIVVSIVNIFLHSSMMEWIISAAGVAIFIGLTAWDTQNIKRMALATPIEFSSKVATLGALSLYLDFINLFLYLLRFLNNRS